jgi:hypothetical protein
MSNFRLTRAKCVIGIPLVVAHDGLADRQQKCKNQGDPRQDLITRLAQAIFCGRANLAGQVAEGNVRHLTTFPMMMPEPAHGGRGRQASGSSTLNTAICCIKYPDQQATRIFRLQ